MTRATAVGIVQARILRRFLGLLVDMAVRQANR